MSDSIGIAMLFVLFVNFDDNTFDLYDMIVKALGAQMKTKKESLAEQKRREKANLRIIEGQKLEGKTLIKDQRFRLGEYYDEQHTIRSTSYFSLSGAKFD